MLRSRLNRVQSDINSRLIFQKLSKQIYIFFLQINVLFLPKNNCAILKSILSQNTPSFNALKPVFKLTSTPFPFPSRKTFQHRPKSLLKTLNALQETHTYNHYHANSFSLYFLRGSQIPIPGHARNLKTAEWKPRKSAMLCFPRGFSPSPPPSTLSFVSSGSCRTAPGLFPPARLYVCVCERVCGMTPDRLKVDKKRGGEEFDELSKMEGVEVDF